MGKYAHFENSEPSNLYDLYRRHAEVVRDIHENTLRKFTGNPDLKVDLVRENALNADKAVLEKMSKYDVVSVSMAYGKGAEKEFVGLYDKHNVDTVRKFLAQNEMPIYLFLQEMRALMV